MNYREIENFGIFSIKEKGIYTITGANGSGKTTFIEKELKKKYSYYKNKNVAYFSQKNWKYNMTSKDFLTVPNLNKELVEQYCSIFSIDYLNKKIEILSGGEFVKLKLVRCLALDTSVIVLDEPTNNLDDTATNILKDILIALSKTKVIYLISHDERLENLFDKKILIDKNMIQVSDNISISNDFKQTNGSKKVSYKVIFLNLLKSKFHLVSFTMIFLLTSILTILISTMLLYTVPIEPELKSDDYLELLDISEPYSRFYNSILSEEELNNNFTELNYLSSEELLELSKKDYTENVYIIDQSYINELMLDNTKLEIVSLPDIVTSSPNYKKTFPISEGHLVQGRLPQDNQNEAVVSLSQLDKFWNFDIESEKILGEKITINDTIYTIVGINSFPVAAISYSSQLTGYGCIQVSQANFDKLTNVLSIMLDQGYDNPYFSNIFIQANEERMPAVLEFLLRTGPSYQYSSNYVNKVVQFSIFKDELNRIILISIALSLIVFTLLFIFGSKFFNTIDNFINDMNNLNFSVRKNKALLYCLLLIDYIILIPNSLFWNQLIMKDKLGIYMILPTLLISAIMFVLTLILLNYKEKISDSKNLL